MSVALKKLDGVESADVSLNEGRVSVQFASENAVTINQLRRTIRDQGFSPKDAILTVSAVIEMRDGVLVAVVPGSGAAYTLTAEESIRSRLTSGTGGTVIVRGRVAADENDETPTSLAVTLLGGG